MATNAIYTYGTAAGGSSTQPAASLTTPAPNLWDGSIGDAATGYAYGSNSFLLDVATNNGGTATPCIRVTFQSSASASMLIYGSTNGTSWSYISSTTATGAGTINFGSTQTYKYYQAVIYSGTGTLTDLRIYDASNVALLGGTPVPDTTAPVVASSTINATTLTINWTEAASPPVLQASGFGTTQGLTLTGLSGGATTVSGVSTSGLITTATLSRIVAQGETGASLSGSASAFSDSYSTHNYTSAFTVTPTVTTPALPAAPTAAPTYGTTAWNSVTLNNVPALSSGATSLVIQRATSSTFGSFNTFSATPSTNYTDTTVAASTTYYYRYADSNTGGTTTGPYSSVTTPAQPAATNAIYTYATTNSYSSTQLPASSVTTAAPLLYDGSIGDTSTGYPFNSNGNDVFLLDVATANGGTATPCSKITFQASTSAYFYLWGSANGTSWNYIAGNSFSSGAVTSTFGSTQTYKYYQLVPYGGAGNVTDLRIYDTSGVALVGPSSAADFTISEGTASQTVSQTGVGTSTVTLTSTNGFVGNVVMSASCPNAGVVGSFLTSPVALSSGGTATTVLHVAVGAVVAPGTYVVTLTGTSGALTHTTTISVTVTFTPTVFSEGPIFTDTFSHGVINRNFAEGPIFTDTFTFGRLIVNKTFSEGPVFSDTFSISGVTRRSAIFVEAPVFTDSFSFGHKTAAAASWSETVFRDFLVTLAVTLPPVTFNETVFSDHYSAGIIRHAPVTFVEPPVFSDTGGRDGNTTGGGHGSVPYVFFEGPIFSDTATFGTLRGSARVSRETVFSDTLSVGTMRRAPVTISEPPVFSDYLLASGVQPKALPTAVDQRDPFTVIRQFLAQLSLIKGSQMISPAKLLAILDKVAASYRSAEAQAQANTLVAVETLIIGQDGIQGLTYGTGDEAFILKTVSAADQMAAAANPDVRNAAIYNPFFSTINSYLAMVGGSNFSNLDTYATYQNGLTRNSFLVPQQAAYLQFLYQSKQGSLLMSPSNVFAPATNFGVATITGANAATFAHSASIPTANIAASNTQGFTPAPGISAQISQAISGTCTLTVTANGQTASGATVSGRTWTGTLSSASVGQVIALTPTVAGDRISDVTAVAVSGAAGSGSFTLQSVLERVVS